MSGPEKTFENKVKKYLREKGVYVVKTFGNGFTRAGIPDLLCCIKGKFLAVELKAENGVLSELQKYNIDLIQKSGGIAMELRPSGFEEFKMKIEEMIV